MKRQPMNGTYLNKKIDQIITKDTGSKKRSVFKKGRKKMFRSNLRGRILLTRRRTTHGFQSHHITSFSSSSPSSFYHHHRRRHCPNRSHVSRGLAHRCVQRSKDSPWPQGRGYLRGPSQRPLLHHRQLEPISLVFSPFHSSFLLFLPSQLWQTYSPSSSSAAI